MAPEYRDAKPAELMQIAGKLDEGDRLVAVIKGTTIEGEDVTKTVALQLGSADGKDGRARLRDAGLTVVGLGEQQQIAQVKFGSRAAKSGWEQGWDIETVKVPTDRPTAHWFYLPALLLAGLVWWAQGRRLVAPRRTAAAVA
jgi:hypothetical protein